MIEYKPSFLFHPNRIAKVQTGWEPNQDIIPAIIVDFGVTRDTAIEFGVDYGFSTSVFAEYFKEVTGVDWFQGDKHAGTRDNFEEAKVYLRPWRNIKLIKSDYKDFIASHNERYNLAHVDIVHTFEDTYACGKWAIEHADIVLFHDTLSHPESVAPAVGKLAREYDKEFYNYPVRHGLGILI